MAPIEATEYISVGRCRCRKLLAYRLIMLSNWTISPYFASHFLDTDIVKCPYNNFPGTIDLTQRVR